MTTPKNALSNYFMGHADREALAWCSDLLENKIADLEDRSRRAMINDQASLHWALVAQLAVVRLLRERVRTEFWRRANQRES